MNKMPPLLLLLLTAVLHGSFHQASFHAHGLHVAHIAPTSMAPALGWRFLAVASTDADNDVDPILVYARSSVLVLYHLAERDEASLDNFNFFLREAVFADDRTCDFVILHNPGSQVQKMIRSKLWGGIMGFDRLPNLPSHAQYEELTEKQCGNAWAVYDIALEEGLDLQRPLESYSSIFLIDSYVRGPFIPPILKDMVPWWQPFLQLLLGDTAMVGSAISCEADPYDESSIGLPFVRLHSVAVTLMALQLMRSDGVFKCHEGGFSSSHGTELLASMAVLRSGHNIDCMMIRYQGLNWLDDKNWGCNAIVDPFREFAYDGISIDPFEVVFVPVDAMLLQQERSAVTSAIKYGAWMHDDAGNASERILSNQFSKEMLRFKVPKILEKIAHEKDCFDFEFYLRRNKDLYTGKFRLLNSTEPELVWEHFVYFGQFQPRQFRFTCPMDYQQFAGFRRLED